MLHLDAGAVAAPVAAAVETSSDEMMHESFCSRLLAEKGLMLLMIKGSGKGGRISKEDVEKLCRHLQLILQQAAATLEAAPVVALGERTKNVFR